jgi:hypothetical protein
VLRSPHATLYVVRAPRAAHGQGGAAALPAAVAEAGASLAKMDRLLQEVRAVARTSHWSNTGQTLVKHWSNTGQTLVKHWPSAGQTLVKHWSNTGQTLAKRWSNARQHRAGSPASSAAAGP